MRYLVFAILLIGVTLFAEPRYRIKANVSKTFDTSIVNMINENFDDIDINKQDRKYQIYASTPTASQLQEGYIVLYSTGIAIKINGVVKLFRPVN
jgi:hypothetical protein